MTERVRNLHLIPGVSASGKTTMARYMSGVVAGAEVSIGYTTRPPRDGEVEGRDYYFRDAEHHEKMMANPQGGWKSSDIGFYKYYSPDSNVIPTDKTPVRILPVAYSALRDVERDYRPVIGDGLITIVPIVIDKAMQTAWLERMQPLRPQRDLQQELEEQDCVLRENSFDATSVPSWQGALDGQRYANLYRSIIEARRKNI